MRLATCADVEAIRTIERAADGRFREVGLDMVADGAPVAFAFAEVLDGLAYLAQLSVLPSHGRRGIGAALVGAVERWARDHGLGSLTLTTFADVPWNAPYYERLGFSVVPEALWTPGLRERIVAQTELFGRWRRVAMAKPLLR